MIRIIALIVLSGISVLSWSQDEISFYGRDFFLLEGTVFSDSVKERTIGTVDGIHLTDLGFLRYADHLIRNFKEFGLVSDSK